MENENVEYDNYDSDEDSDFDPINIDNLLIGEQRKQTIPFHCKTFYTKGDFEVLNLCGKGAYAKVVKAKCVQNNEIKALKIIDKNFLLKENKIYQVYLENEVLLSLDHPNIIKIESVFEELDKMFMVLEYADNGDFFEFMKNNCRID